MKDDVILKVENLSKQYRLGLVGTGTISHDLNRFLARIRGKEDPYLKIGESNDRSTKGTSEYVWALKDINFEVKRGEILGIIGKNGAGKSTLLKILSKVTGPSTGAIKSKGRIASLLEVGTGFHPEMTGKENIFLNGAILGMTKKEIASKLDEIIEFSGCERYVETPVKRYSSGMKVRLAFAVAAFLEPDILVVDEVLAVGDAEFQKKAIGKMQDISSQGGRTVLFVSHDMGAIQNLCSRLLVLGIGKIDYYGEVKKGIDSYLNGYNILFDSKGFVHLEKPKNTTCFVKSISLLNKDNQITNSIFMGDLLTLLFDVECKSKLEDFEISVFVRLSNGEKIFTIKSSEQLNSKLNVSSNFNLKIDINDMNLMPNDYFITIAYAIDSVNVLRQEDCIGFKILPNIISKSNKIINATGEMVFFNCDYTLIYD
jgi:lipopolysaccharide transport system ATP-binding protein